MAFQVKDVTSDQDIFYVDNSNQFGMGSLPINGQALTVFGIALVESNINFATDVASVGSSINLVGSLSVPPSSSASVSVAYIQMATVTSAGAVTLTGGGSNYDPNYLPILYPAGLTCTANQGYPREQSLLTNGVITGLSLMNGPSGCTGTGTIQFINTEPVWNNFNATAVNGLAANACLKQTFVFDSTASTIN